MFITYHGDSQLLLTSSSVLEECCDPEVRKAGFTKPSQIQCETGASSSSSITGGVLGGLSSQHRRHGHGLSHYKAMT
eukprot:5858969-Amphidinium_carterae.1